MGLNEIHFLIIFLLKHIYPIWYTTRNLSKLRFFLFFLYVQRINGITALCECCNFKNADQLLVIHIVWSPLYAYETNVKQRIWVEKIWVKRITNNKYKSKCNRANKTLQKREERRKKNTEKRNHTCIHFTLRGIQRQIVNGISKHTRVQKNGRQKQRKKTEKKSNVDEWMVL